MVGIAAVIALLLFIYVNRSIQKRRENIRESRHGRREEFMQNLLATKRKKEAKNENNADKETGTGS
jgi:hypothetical protein